MEASREAFRRVAVGWKDANATRLVFNYSRAVAFQYLTNLYKR